MELNIRSELSLELTKIIACPYPASLSTLDHLLAHADEVTVQACIHDRTPCGVTRLAALVCDALPLWAHTPRVLQSLCSSPEFTEKLLLQSPGLLDALLVKATSSQQDFGDYLKLCVQLLSRPLPVAISLPASAQSFFLRVFERATQHPDVSTFQPVYTMLNGACRNLLKLLPADVRQQFDRELCHILASNGTGQNSMLLLWCFGIVILAEHPEDLSNSQNFMPDQPTATTSFESQWTTASGRKLFGSSNGLYKTINLTYLSVIWAIKGDVGVSDAEALEGIRIAVRTLRFVDVELRAGWPNSSALARNIFPKLPAKISRDSINSAIQLEALCFYAMIAGTEGLPMEIVAQYQCCLATLDDFADTESLREILLISLPIFAPKLEDSLLRALILDTVNTCAFDLRCPSLTNLVTLVDSLSAASSTSLVLRTKLLVALSSTASQSKVWNLVRATTTVINNNCSTHASSLHREAIAATISFLLNLTISAPSEELSLPQQLASALISKQRKLRHVSNPCVHTTSSLNGSSISLFQQESTPVTGQHLQDWKSRLHSELESQNSYQRDSIVRSVAQICQDLETRCNTVEEPLRREKEKSRGLEQRVEELIEQVSSLESQAADDRFHLDGLEDEKLCLADEKDRITAKFEELRKHFEDANRAASEALRTAQEDSNARELELRSTIMNHVDLHRTAENNVQELSKTISKLRESLKHTEEELCVLGARNEELQTRLEDTGRQLVDEREAKLQQSEDVLRLKERSINLEHQLQTAEAELEAVTRHLSDLEVSHKELKQSSTDALTELDTKFTTDMEAAATRAELEYNKLKNKLNETLQSGRQVKVAHDKTRSEFHSLQNKFSALEVRAQELDILCGEQEEELEELRTLRKNVLASMGLGTQNPLSFRSATRPQKDGLVPETPRGPQEHRRRKSAIQTQDLAPAATATSQNPSNSATENAAEMSFASTGHDSQNGSTPKRQKPRSSVLMSAMQTPFSQKPILASLSTTKKLSPVKRSALRQMSPNRRHTTVGFALSEIEGQGQVLEVDRADKEREDLHRASHEDLDMDDFLADTPLTPGAFASGTGRLPDDGDLTVTEL